MSTRMLAIVVEGRSDAEIIRAILGKEVAKHVRFFTGQGKTSLASVGRNILVDEGGPILVVMDSDTTNQRMADENKGMMRLALSRFAAPEDYDAFQFVPCIEVVFFEAPEALRIFLKRDIPKETLRDGLLIPKVKLAALQGDENATITKGQIDANVGELLATGKQATAFRETVQRLLTQHAEV
jgi:hypothetical protein